MGKKKLNWRKKYSPQGLKTISQSSKIAEDRIAEEIYRIVRKGYFQSNRCNRVSKCLLFRLDKPKPLLPLGEIKNFEIPIKYVKPKNHDSDLSIGKNFGVYLSAWHHVGYIIMLKNERGNPAILVTWGEEGFLVGAANFLLTNKRDLKYPSFLYDPQKIESLFNIECIRPYTPSSNYKIL